MPSYVRGIFLHFILQQMWLCEVCLDIYLFYQWKFFFHIAESGHRCYFLQYEKFVSAEVNDSTCNIQQKLVAKHLLSDKLRENVVHISRLLYAKNGRNHFNRSIVTVAESISIGKDFTSDERASQFWILYT